MIYLAANSIETASATLVAAAAGIGAVLLLVKYGWRGMKGFWGFLNIMVNAGKTIQRELNPNGGESTYDLVRKVRAKVDDHDVELKHIKETTDQAVTAAGLAVNEAKVGRKVIDEAKEIVEIAIAEARQAAVIAADAAREARESREHVAANLRVSTHEVEKVQGMIVELYGTVEKATHQTRLQEVAFVQALKKVGVDLTEVTKELVDEHDAAVAAPLRDTLGEDE